MTCNIKTTTGKKIEKTLEDICIGNHFLNKTPIAPEIKAKINKLGLHQIKKFLHIN
jgi:hypothetical protein